MNKPPAFQWYPKDILSSKRVAMMTLAEEGAYRRAIDFCWLHGSLPSDPKQLSMLIGKSCTTKIAETVKSMFVEENGELRHDRLDAERIKQEDWRIKKSRAGKISAQLRQEKNIAGNTNPTGVEQVLQQTANTGPTLRSSVSSLRSLSPKSTEVQIPAGSEKKINEKTGVKVDLPWPSNAFTEMWQKWKNFRAAEKRVKFKTPESELAQLKRLHDLAYGDEKTAINIIEQSIGNQWTGLFQLPNNKNNSANGNGNNPAKPPLWRR